jgi:hypothetical protein
MHSVKNRFLMRMKNISPHLFWKNWGWILFRDLQVIACCLLWEHSSLNAFWYLIRNRRRIMAKRALIQANRRVSDEYIAGWFSYRPVSHEAPRRPAAHAVAHSQQAAKTS